MFLLFGYQQMTFNRNQHFSAAWTEQIKKINENIFREAEVGDADLKQLLYFPG